ncbi:MAG: addiction module protein [Bifidobacteriaceae bacterium]|jgi:putative addiction module component (TIGR02574 family)|nr:addiction module protein [Bifidobacteriaceae bacterium]
MVTEALLAQIEALPVDERVELSAYLDRSIEAEARGDELSQSTKDLLDGRLAAMEARPDAARPLEDVMADLAERHRL